MKNITTYFGLIWPSSGYIQRVSEICKNYIVLAIWPSSGYIQRVSEICKNYIVFTDLWYPLYVTWWWPDWAETCSYIFLSCINIVEIICCVVDGTPLPIIHTHNGDGTFQKWWPVEKCLGIQEINRLSIAAISISVYWYHQDQKYLCHTVTICIKKRKWSDGYISHNGNGFTVE